MYINIIAFSTLIFITASCAKTPETSKQTSAIIRSFSREMHREKGLELFSFGGSNTYTNINVIATSFTCQKKVDIDEARELIVSITESLLNKINETPVATALIEGHIATTKNIDISIHFRDKFGNPLPDNLILIVASRHNKVFYIRYNETIPHIEVIASELYEEALEKVHAQDLAGKE